MNLTAIFIALSAAGIAATLEHDGYTFEHAGVPARIYARPLVRKPVLVNYGKCVRQYATADEAVREIQKERT